MFSPRSARRQEKDRPEAGPSSLRQSPVHVATAIATEYASLSAPGACPRGIYLTPSPESLLSWEGVLFVHQGPYARAILRFSVSFSLDFPAHSPIIRFETDVYHPMVHPKTMIWQPRGDVGYWQPGKHHVVHLLRALEDDFHQSTLDAITEEEAINAQLFKLYKNSLQTFLSMTAQRCLNSSSNATLFPSSAPTPGAGPNGMAPPSPTSSTAPKTPIAPSTPTKSSARVRLNSGLSSTLSKASDEGIIREGAIRFKSLDQGEQDALMARIREGGRR